MIDHMPSMPNCKWCKLAKIHRYPARAKEKVLKMMKFLDEVHLDIIGKITPPTIRGENWILATRDRKSGLRCHALQKTKEAQETMLTFNALYPDALKPKKIRKDLGREFEGGFEENRKHRSFDAAGGLPGRSETHAWIERDHRVVQERTRA